MHPAPARQGMAALRRAIHSLDESMPHWTWTGIKQSTGVTHSLGRKSPKGEPVQHIQKRKKVRWNTKVLPEVCQTPSGAQPVPASPPHPWHCLTWAAGTKCALGLKLCCWHMAMDALIDMVLAGHRSVSFPSASPPYTSCFISLQQHLTNPQTSSIEPAIPDEELLQACLLLHVPTSTSPTCP